MGMEEDGESVIRERRKEMGLGLRELARMIGVSAVYLSLVERKLRRPSYGMIGKLAGAIGVDGEALRKTLRRLPVREMEKKVGRDEMWLEAAWEFASTKKSAGEVIALFRGANGVAPDNWD